MVVCQVCGDAGWVGVLIYCSKCRRIAEHTYCLDQSITDDDGEMRWVCEFCEPRVIELSDSTDQSSETESRQSFRKGEAGEHVVQPSDNGHSDCTNKQRKEKHSVENIRFSSKDSTDNLTETSEITESDSFDTAQPLSESIWRGRCCIYGQYSFTMVARMSTEACVEASEVVRSLPKFLAFDIVPKINIWPLKFRNTVPTADNISVYFFPEDYRAERVYDRLVEYLIEREFAMILKVHSVELLVFSSCELQRNDWRFKRKYYLWGILRRKKETLASNQSDNRMSNGHGSISYTSTMS